MAQGDVENDQARLDEVAKHLYDIKDPKERNAQLAAEALKANDKGKAFDGLSEAIAALEEAGKEKGPSAIAGQFGTPEGRTQVNVGVGFNKSGLTSESATALHGVKESNDYGQYALGARAGLDGTGDLTNASAVARAISPVFGNEDLKHVAFAEFEAGANNLNGQKPEFMTNAVVGAVSWLPKDIGVLPAGLTATNAVVTDFKGAASGFHELSKNVGNDYSVGAFGGYEFSNKEKGFHTPDHGYAGVELQKTFKLDHDVDVTTGVKGSYNNIGEQNAGFAGAAFVRVEFGEKAKAPEAESASAPYAAQVAEAEKPHNFNYDFRGLSKEDQKTVIGFMTESTGKSEAEIRSQLEKAGYKVNANGTENYRDDTPMRAEELVASR